VPLSHKKHLPLRCRSAIAQKRSVAAATLALRCRSAVAQKRSVAAARLALHCRCTFAQTHQLPSLRHRCAVAPLPHKTHRSVSTPPRSRTKTICSHNQKADSGCNYAEAKLIILIILVKNGCHV